MKLFFYSVFIFLLASCNGSKKGTATIATDKTNAKAETSTTTSFKPDIRTLSIELERTACFGACPIYKLNVDGKTNKATFIGKQYTQKIGT